MSHLQIRKALEKRLNDTIGLTVAIEWMGTGFDRPALLDEDAAGQFIRATYHPTNERVLVMGTANVRAELDGFFKCGVHVAAGRSEDALDLIADEIRDNVFPIGLPLTAGGYKVEITRRERGGSIETAPWLYLPVDIFWNVWRA